MKRKHKKYSKPKRPFDKARIEEEAIIKKKFGLKNKKEIWKADEKVRTMRRRAKRLIKAPLEEQKELFSKLQKIGLKVSSISDVLGLDKTDYLNRRLQTVVFKKKIAPTIKTARQMISHRKILVKGNVVNSPSYVVPIILEKEIKLKESRIKKK